MKKILFLLLTIITVCSCYNDDDLWDKVNDLDGRVETLETTVKKMNSEITTLQSLVDALNQGKIITNTEQTSVFISFHSNHRSICTICSIFDRYFASVIEGQRVAFGGLFCIRNYFPLI